LKDFLEKDNDFMSNLFVIGFDEAHKAEEVRLKLEESDDLHRTGRGYWKSCTESAAKS